jgi:hypothetical protein
MAYFPGHRRGTAVDIPMTKDAPEEENIYDISPRKPRAAVRAGIATDFIVNSFGDNLMTSKYSARNETSSAQISSSETASNDMPLTKDASEEENIYDISPQKSREDVRQAFIACVVAEAKAACNNTTSDEIIADAKAASKNITSNEIASNEATSIENASNETLDNATASDEFFNTETHSQLSTQDDTQHAPSSGSAAQLSQPTEFPAKLLDLITPTTYTQTWELPSVLRSGSSIELYYADGVLLASRTLTRTDSPGKEIVEKGDLIMWNGRGGVEK